MACNWVQFRQGCRLVQFMHEYGSDERCTETPFRWRWPNGFICPRGGPRKSHSQRTFTRRWRSWPNRSLRPQPLNPICSPRPSEHALRPPRGGSGSSRPGSTLLSARSRPRGHRTTMRFVRRSMPSTKPMAACRSCLLRSGSACHRRRQGRVIDGLQRLLNADSDPVLRLSAEAEHVELDGALLIERFELNP